MKSTQKLAFKVISKLAWHSREKEFKIYKDNLDDDVEYPDRIRDLTEEELSAVVSHDFPLRIKADFDERAFSEPNEHIEFINWSLELKPGVTIATIIETIKRMPVYGYWECKPPTLAPRIPRFPCSHPEEEENEPKYMYILTLRLGT